MKLKSLIIALDLLRNEVRKLEAEYRCLGGRLESVPEDSDEYDKIVAYRKSAAERLCAVRLALRDLEEFEIK